MISCQNEKISEPVEKHFSRKGYITMNSKERVMRAIQRQEIDRVPLDITYTSQPNFDRIKTALNMNGKSNEELFRTLGLDTWWIFNPLIYVGEKRYFNGEEADYLGITPSIYAGTAGDSNSTGPLKGVSTVEEVERYPWPSIDDFDGSQLDRILDEHRDFAIIGGVWAPIFHQVAWLCGIEDTYANLILNPEVVEALIRHVTDFWVAYTHKVLQIAKGRIDIIENCNDFGGQHGLIISVDSFRKFMKPALKRLYDTIKEYDVKVFQHSCGAIAPIIPDFIEIGADILNPVQVSAKGMNPEVLKAKFGDKLTFCGGIDTQKVLPFGSEEEVRAEVRRMIGIMGKGGGYILAGSQALEEDIPVENILAMFDEAKRCPVNL